MRARDSAYWQEANKVGIESEQRFFEAFEEHRSEWPGWLKSIRRATSKEDRMGYDAFAELDIGFLPIQIKSSEAGLDKFLRQYSHSHAVGVVVSRTSTSKSIYVDTLAGISWNRDLHLGLDPLTRRGEK